MDATVAHELRGNAERFTTVGALVPLWLGVYAAVVFVRHQIGEFFLTWAAVVGTRLMAVFVVEQGAGVAVPAPTLVANVRLAARVVAAALWRILMTSLHQGQVKPGTPPKVGTAPRGTCQILLLLLVVVVVRGFLGSYVMRLQVQSEAGLTWECALALRAREFSLFLVEPAVVLELREDAERLSAFRAAVPSQLRMDAAVIFQSEQVGVGLEAHGAVIDTDGVSVFMVQQRAGVTV